MRIKQKRIKTIVLIRFLKAVGITGLEPATPSSRTTCATNCAKSRLLILQLLVIAQKRVQRYGKFLKQRNFFTEKFVKSKK